MKTIKRRVTAIRRAILAAMGQYLPNEYTVVHVYRKAVYPR